MRALALVLLLALSALPAPQVAAQSYDSLDRAFDPTPMAPQDLRMIQAGLTLTGDYNGLINGQWNSRSQDALGDYARRTYGTGSPRMIHGAALMVEWARAAALDDWRTLNLPEVPLSLILPFGPLRREGYGDEFPSFSNRDETLRVSISRSGKAGMQSLHRRLKARHTGERPFYETELSGLPISSGTLRGGRRYYLRSLRITESSGLGYANVLIESGPGEHERGALIAGSIRPRLSPELDVVRGGYLDRLIRLALDQLGG